MAATRARLPLASPGMARISAFTGIYNDLAAASICVKTGAEAIRALAMQSQRIWLRS